MSVARCTSACAATVFARARALGPRPALPTAPVRWFSEADNPRRLGTRFIDLRSDTVTKPTPAMALVGGNCVVFFVEPWREPPAHRACTVAAHA